MFLAALCVATVFFSDLIVAQENTTNEQKAILVTGASTGIGRHIAETLA
ncbi:MAG: short-chain dehydrogenase, partial [Gammaproteobacteria bacterium]